MRAFLPSGLFGLFMGVLTLVLALVACTPAQRAAIAPTLGHVGTCLEGCGPLVEEVIAAAPSSSASSSVMTLSVAVPSSPRGPAKRHCTQWTLVDAGADADAGP